MNIGTCWDNKTKILYSREICYCYYVICYYSNDWSTEKKCKIHMVNLSSLIHTKSWVKNIAWVFGIIRCNVLVDILVKCQSRYQLLIYCTSVSRHQSVMHQSSMINWHINWSSVNYRLTVQNQDSIDSVRTMYQWTIGRVSVRVGGVLVEHRECWDKPYVYLDVNNEKQKNNYYSFGRSNLTRIGKAKGTINFSRPGFLVLFNSSTNFFLTM